MNVAFIGSKTIGFHCLQTCEGIAPGKIKAILTIDDHNDTRSALQDILRFGRERNIPLSTYQKSSDLEEFIDKNKPELCIVVGWYWIIKKELLDRVPHGFVGIHNSLLPEYRGWAPLVWAIINGEKEAGVSMFYFSEGLDNGDLVGVQQFSIREEDTIEEVSAKATECSIDILKTHYPKLLSGEIVKIRQRAVSASYCAQRIPEDGRINWEWPAHRVYNFIRAQTYPYPGAFTLLHGQQLTIWKATLLKGVYYGTPGQVACINPNGVTIICGDSKAIDIEIASGTIRAHSTRLK